MTDATANPIRVLVVGPHPPPTGGIATVVRNLLAIRFRVPIETRIFDPSDVEIPAFLAMPGLRSLGRLGVFSLWGPATWWCLGAYWRRLVDDRPDVVHIHTSSGQAFWQASLLAIAARFRRIRVLMHFHASSMDEFYESLGPIERRLFARCLRVPDVCIALSERWAGWYARFLPPERLAVLPNCIDWQLFKPDERAKPAGRARVLFVGLMYARRKGAHDVIAAARRVVAAVPGVEFVLVGSDDEGVVESLDVDGTTRAALRFPGDLSPESLRTAYHDASVFVLPSYREGMPMVMLEAMAAGLPVICGNVNAIPEVVQDGVNGFLVEPGDVDGIASRIIEVLQDPGLRQRIGDAASAWIRDRHDLAVQAAKLEALYVSVARGDGAPR